MALSQAIPHDCHLAKGCLDVHQLMQRWLALPVSEAVALPALVWFTLLLAFWVNPWCSVAFKQQAADRFLSTVHAIVTGLLGLSLEFLTTPQCISRGTWASVPMLIFLGYLAVDLLSMCICDIWQRWRPIDKAMLLHHVMILALFSLGYAYDIGIWFGSTLLINEISTPFVNMFWYLQYTGRKESKAFRLNGMALLFIFFACRVLYIPYNFYEFAVTGFCQDTSNAAYRNLGWLMGVGYMAIYALNGMWFSKLLQGALKALRADRKKGVEQELTVGAPIE